MSPISGAVVSIVGGYALLVWASGNGPARVLRVGGSTGSIAGLEVRSGAVAGRALLLLGIALVLAAVSALTFRTAVGTSVVWVGIGVAAVVIGFAVLPGAADLYAVMKNPVFTCAGSTVETCMLAGNDGHLTAWSDAIGTATARLSKDGLRFPSRYSEEAPGPITDRAGGVIVTDPATVNESGPSRSLLVESLASPGLCAAFGSRDSPNRIFEAQSWLASWMFYRLWDTIPPPSDPSFTAWTHHTSTAAQAAWAASAFNDIKTCSLATLRPPA